MNYGGLFDPEAKKSRLAELEQEMNKPNFWDNRQASEKIIGEINEIKRNLSGVEELKKQITEDLEILELLKKEYDEETKQLIEQNIQTIQSKLESLEISLLLNGEYDQNDAILEIHSGAGGTEACDWANMLYRMYTRWCEDKNYKVEIVDMLYGEEAGIKSATIIVRGINAYGYLKNEKGVHRLIRISPFDANSRRHTSFASVDVTPLFKNDINIEIKESDLIIDVFRSSGAGGQHVNTTDSAVRITHIPTKIVVTCQNERSQIQNREKALAILKNKLYQLELEKKENELKELKGGPTDINFGSQIRSYVLHPYSMVKDHRTNVETGNATKVLDGDLDMFINASLKNK